MTRTHVAIVALLFLAALPLLLLQVFEAGASQPRRTVGATTPPPTPLDLGPPLDLTLPDSGDAMFIEVGVAENVDYLVTGNLKHFPNSQRQGLCVVSPREFVQAVIEDR